MHDLNQKSIWHPFLHTPQVAGLTGSTPLKMACVRHRIPQHWGLVQWFVGRKSPWPQNELLFCPTSNILWCENFCLHYRFTSPPLPLPTSSLYRLQTFVHFSKLCSGLSKAQGLLFNILKSLFFCNMLLRAAHCDYAQKGKSSRHLKWEHIILCLISLHFMIHSGVLVFIILPISSPASTKVYSSLFYLWSTPQLVGSRGLQASWVICVSN